MNNGKRVKERHMKSEQLPAAAEDASLPEAPTPSPSAKHAPPSMALSWSEAGVLQVSVDGDMGRFRAATQNQHVNAGLVSQIASLGSHGQRMDETASNFALGFVDSMKPKDAAEALLLTQMAAIHLSTMMLARRLNHVETIPQQDAAERALNKLARTFAGQVDTLKRYRSKGQQVVRVERVTVESGAQAVVGTVTHGGEGQR